MITKKQFINSTIRPLDKSIQETRHALTYNPTPELKTKLDQLIKNKLVFMKVLANN